MIQAALRSQQLGQPAEPDIRQEISTAQPVPGRVTAHLSVTERVNRRHPHP